MKIVHIASEFAPIAKVGGLADVMLGLSRELIRQGHDVSVILPKYELLKKSALAFDEEPKEFQSYFDGKWYTNTAWIAPVEKSIPVTFIEAHHPENFFSGDCIYGAANDVDRFCYFCRAVIDYLANDPPDILHLHDWETATCALLLRQEEFRKKFAKTKVVLTIHNIAYQGHSDVMHLEKTGLTRKELEEIFEHIIVDKCVILKGGILAADFITTVSPTYAGEVLTHEGGKGLEATLRACSYKFCGVLNGIDTIFWDPGTDPYIDSHYCVDFQSIGYEFHQMIQKKQANKWALVEKFGLQKDPTKPLLTMISRLVFQKGIDLMKHILFETHKFHFQCILLGTSPDPQVHTHFVELSHQFAHHPDVRIILQQEEALAHKLYAASDMFLVPSIFEPCGLTQLIALRYGAIPIVRKTGGLADTVFDVDFSAKLFEERNGYVFDHANSEEMDAAVHRAVQCWTHDKRRWKQLVLHAMQCDHSWKRSAGEYVQIYERLCF